MSASQPPPENVQSNRSSSYGSSWSAPPDGSAPSRGDPGSQANPRAVPAAPPAAGSRGFQPAHGYGTVRDSARGYGTVRDSAGGYGAGRGYGANYGMPVRARRSGAEIGHLIGVCIVLFLFILRRLAPYMGEHSDPLARLLLGILLDSLTWFMVGAIIQAVRRRPTAMTVAAFVSMGLRVVSQLALWGNLLGVIVDLVLLLALGIVGFVSTRANRNIDGRPVPVTLAAGVCTEFAVRGVAFFAGMSYYVMIRMFGPEALVPGPWFSLNSSLIFSLPPVIPLSLFLISIAGAMLGLSGILAPHGSGARGRLVAGSLITACACIAFYALPAVLNPRFAEFPPTPRPIPALVIVILLLLGMTLPVLTSGRQWFDARKRAKAAPAAGAR